MGKAYKCDFCGGYFDNRPIPLKRYVVIGTRLQPAHKEMDLCNKCYNKLDEFLKNGDA